MEIRLHWDSRPHPAIQLPACIFLSRLLFPVDVRPHLLAVTTARLSVHTHTSTVRTQFESLAFSLLQNKIPGRLVTRPRVMIRQEFRAGAGAAIILSFYVTTSCLIGCVEFGTVSIHRRMAVRAKEIIRPPGWFFGCCLYRVHKLSRQERTQGRSTLRCVCVWFTPTVWSAQVATVV